MAALGNVWVGLPPPDIFLSVIARCRLFLRMYSQRVECVSVLVTRVSCAKTAEPTQLPFEQQTRVDQWGYILAPPGKYNSTIRARRRCGLSLALL